MRHACRGGGLGSRPPGGASRSRRSGTGSGEQPLRPASRRDILSHGSGNLGANCVPGLVDADLGSQDWEQERIDAVDWPEDIIVTGRNPTLYGDTPDRQRPIPCHGSDPAAAFAVEERVQSLATPGPVPPCRLWAVRKAVRQRCSGIRARDSGSLVTTARAPSRWTRSASATTSALAAGWRSRGSRGATASPSAPFRQASSEGPIRPTHNRSTAWR